MYEREQGGGVDLVKAGVGPDSFVVVATMGRYDEDALEPALAAAPRYVALVASERRAASVLESLRAAGVPEAQLARVHAPAGLDLGDLPHVEIAVAVLAQMVAEKARSEAVQAVPPEAPAAVIDPVCGMTVEPATAADSFVHEGVTYSFCAGGCRRRFEADPTSYLP